MSTIADKINHTNYTAELHAQAYLETERLREAYESARGRLHQAQNHAFDLGCLTRLESRSPITIITHKSAENGKPSKAVVITPPSGGRSADHWGYTITQVIS